MYENINRVLRLIIFHFFLIIIFIGYQNGLVNISKGLFLSSDTRCDNMMPRMQFESVKL